MAQRLRNRRRNNVDEDDEQDDVQTRGDHQDNNNAAEDILNDPGKYLHDWHTLIDHKLSKKEIIKLQKKHEKDRMRDAMRQNKEAQDQRRMEIEAKQEEEDLKR